MNGKSMVVLGLAGLSGLGAMYGTRQMLANGGGAAPVEMRDVLVAARDLNVEEVLKPDAVKVVRMAKANAPADGFASPADVESRWVQVKTLEGEPIVSRKLAPKGNPAGLVSRIPKGMRAYAIEINEQTGVSGFIMPDHRVDVIQAKSDVQGEDDEAETILQDVLVLAAGQVFTRADDKNIQARTVTLAVTPEMVDTLVSARSKGPLSLSLRGLEDRERVSKPKPKAPAEAPKPAEPTLLERLAALAKKVPPPTPPPPPPLASRIPRGMRALTVEVKDLGLASGLVTKDSRVDVIGLEAGKGGGAEVVLQDVLVLEAGAPASGADKASAPASASKTVTLAVPIAEAGRLVAAQARGPLTLSLRGPDDREVLAKAAPPAPRPMRYLYIHRGLENPDRVLFGASGAEDSAPEPRRLVRQPAPAPEAAPAGPEELTAPVFPPDAAGEMILGRTP